MLKSDGSTILRAVVGVLEIRKDTERTILIIQLTNTREYFYIVPLTAYYMLLHDRMSHMTSRTACTLTEQIYVTAWRMNKWNLVLI